MLAQPRSTVILSAFSIAVCLLACSGGAPDSTAPDTTAPLVRDTAAPYPIDAPTASGRPSSYKGLPLTLTPRNGPTVTPVDDVIGVVCIGMSNANQECARLQTAISNGGPWAGEVNPAVRLVNCAVGGNAIERWIDPAFDATLWGACLTVRLPARGVRPEQVRVVLHKAANQFGVAPSGGALPLYPSTASNFYAFERHLTAFAARVRPMFPSTQAVYTASRSYGGYTPRPERGEPQAYEEGHALNRWLAANPEVEGVWYGWWAYLWAPDCATGVRNGGGVCYERSDFVEDAVHPSAAGEIKIARLMHERLLQEQWYRTRAR